MCPSRRRCATAWPASRSRSKSTSLRTSTRTRTAVWGRYSRPFAAFCGSSRNARPRPTHPPTARATLAGARIATSPIFFQVAVEISSTLSTLRAVARLHGQTTGVDADGRLTSIGTARLLWFSMVQAVRLLIAAGLCYGGSYFIAHTIALGDLILNCIALEFVLEVDELLYNAFAPMKLKVAMTKAAELDLPPLRTFHGLDLPPVFRLCSTLVLIGIMVGTNIAPQTQFLTDAGDAMCGTCMGLVQFSCRHRDPRSFHGRLRRWPTQLGFHH
jgi:hypothetical protein